MTPRALVLACVGFAGAARMLGCSVDGIDFSRKSCPCPDGWSCNTLTNRCQRGSDPAGSSGGMADMPDDPSPGGAGNSAPVSGSGGGGTRPDVSDAGAGGDAGAGDGAAAGAAGDGATEMTECQTRIESMHCFGSARFAMGDSEYRAPVHEVTLQAFYIDVQEVTVAEYEVCVAERLCPPTEPHATEAKCNSGASDREDHPINCVSWIGADTYCRWAGKRLPTEEEWEYAALAGVRKYPWGDDPPSAERLNIAGDEWTGAVSAWGRDDYAAMAPPGSFPLGNTPEGLVDMAGNAWEWTASKHCAYPSAPCSSCRPGIACRTPCANCASEYWVHRGGGYLDQPNDAPSLWRGYGSVQTWTEYLGFRCAR